ncbi:MAG: glycosyltransferase family 4 protein [Sedimentisphaerales bacterium]|nr:glycosyltransferase family 4 protein [Sedimentisphaerales bacterium]
MSHAQKKHVGFVATRLAGNDGVSLECAKWASVFEREGFSCFYYAGELDRPPERSLPVPEAHFQHPAIRQLQEECFGAARRRREVTRQIQQLKDLLKESLYAFLERFDISLLVIENALTIPMNLPLGLGLTELISETGIPTIAHHHDFFWERQRFLSNCVWDYLNMAFPPHLPSIRHVVINSSADNQLSLRTGISPTLIPNVMDFESPPPAPNHYAADIRASLGIARGEYFVLQPTRIIRRKGIEHAVELVSRLGLPARLIISHAAGDEGHEYEQRIRSYARLLQTNTLFVSDLIRQQRGRTQEGQKQYTPFDIYPYCDLVTYPSDFEGFGNAFLEAVYFRKPLVLNTYSIYTYDIKPKGFRAIELHGYVTEESLQQTRSVLQDEHLRREMVDHNYQLARRYYSYAVLRCRLRSLIHDCLGVRYAGLDAG